MKLLQSFMDEACADMADIPPGIFLAHCKDERSKKWPCSPWSRESCDDDLLAFRSFDFQPVLGAATRVIGAARALGHDAFKALPLGLLEERPAGRLAVTAEGNQLVARQDVFEPLFALEQGEGERNVVRLTTNEFVAFGQKCTHLSCAVIPRPAENSFYCPCHEGRFDLRTGAPTAGPPRRPLTRIVLDVRGRYIYAVGIEERT